jgi:hypothetical protein
MNWWEWVFSGIGVAGIALLTQLLRKKKSPSASVSVQGGKIDRSIVASGHGIDQKIEVHEHNYPAPVSTAPTTKPVPNFSYVGPQSKFVFFSDFPREGVHEPHNAGEQSDAVFALVLKFTNQVIPGQRVGRALDVIATIKFRSQDGATEQRIDYGVWLKSPCASTDLEVGDTRELLLLIDASDHSLRALEDKRTDINYPEQFTYLRVANVTHLLNSIEVTLTDRRSQVTFHRKFRVWMEGAHFNVVEIA